MAKTKNKGTLCDIVDRLWVLSDVADVLEDILLGEDAKQALSLIYLLNEDLCEEASRLDRLLRKLDRLLYEEDAEIIKFLEKTVEPSGEEDEEEESGDK